jgi:hypothetical protein
MLGVLHREIFDSFVSGWASNTLPHLPITPNHNMLKDLTGIAGQP